MTAKDCADVAISIDADLQDDINVINKMINDYKNGSDIVYGVRSSRDTDSFFKRFSAEAFYKTMNKLGINSVYNHADFRLMSKKALYALEQYNEVNLFLRCIAKDIGFKSSIVEYERKERVSGESKYPLHKMLSFAWQGISSFSVKSLRFVLLIGVASLVIGAFVVLYCLIRFFEGFVVPGWTFIVVSIWIIASFEFIALAIIAEYVGKIYQESKRRPKYFIDCEI